MDCDSDVVDDLNTGFIRKSVRWEDQQKRAPASGKSRRDQYEEGRTVHNYTDLDSDFDSDLEDEKTLVVDVSNESSDFSAGTYV